MPRRKATNSNSSESPIALLASSGEVVEAELVEPGYRDPEPIRQQAIADAEQDFQNIYLPAYHRRMQELISQHRATAGVGTADLMDVINSMPFTRYDY